MATTGAPIADNKSAPPLPAVTTTNNNNNNNNNNNQQPYLPGHPPPATKETPIAPVSSRPPEPPSNRSDVILIPSHSGWFSWNSIHECEFRFLPEFFEGRSASKNPRVYKYYRNSIIQRFRENPNRKITFTEARKTIIGDVGSVRRIFDFLETWGLINYIGSPSSKPQKWEDKETTKLSSNNNNAATAPGSITSGNDSGANISEKKRLCSVCKSVCSIACFACDKDDVTLCARCFVRGSYKVGVSSSDFRRVEISDEVKTDWTDKETLHLLEAIMHYCDDWKRVAEHVGGRSARECVAHFVKLPFGEHFIGPPDSSLVDDKIHQPNGQSSTEFGLRSTTFSPSKRMRLNPLADASNPIMAQAAFLSALVGVDVAEAAAIAAVWSLYEGYNSTGRKEILGSVSGGGAGQQESCVASNSNTTKNALEEAQLQIENEEGSMEKAILSIIEQMKEIQEKIAHFEEFDLQMEKKSQQLEQMKTLLFADQLTLLFHKTATPKSQESLEKNVKVEGQIS